MAREIRSFAVTTPAGTAAASPLLTEIPFPPRTVDSVQIRVPPGPAGSVGFTLSLAGVPVIPCNLGEWIITDDEVIDWDLTGYPDSGAWQLTTYNTGQLDHTIYVRFLLDLAGQTATPSSGLLPVVGMVSADNTDAADLVPAGLDT